MANCENCGSALSAFNEAYPLWVDCDRKLCKNCSTRFEKQLRASGMLMGSPRITREVVLSISEKLNYSEPGKQLLLDYAAFIQANRAPTPEELALEEEKKKEEEKAKKVALAKILISSGFNFEGYRIVKYSGYISGDDAVQIPRSGIFDRGRNGENLTEALVKIRRQALTELKEAAYNLGCNAVIGVDFDYLTLDPETATITGGTLYEPYVICVTANGNAVVIEKIED